MKKIKKVILLLMKISIVLIALTFILLLILVKYNGIAKDFDAASFIEKTGSTRNDLLLFTDIANSYGRIFKWESDIKVEIIDIERFTSGEIAEVDSVITLIAPFILPVKMERVSKNGNFRVYRKVEKIQQLYSKKIEVGGFVRYNKNSIFGQLRQVSVFENKQTTNGLKLLMHEFLHALGLQHASKVYPFPLCIGTDPDARRRYTHASMDAFEAYMELDKRYLISPQEGQVLRMLYSPMIKPGMRIDHLKEKFAIKHEK